MSTPVPALAIENLRVEYPREDGGLLVAVDSVSLRSRPARSMPSWANPAPARPPSPMR